MQEQRSSRDRFVADLERTVDRLRTLGLARLEASFEPEPTRAAAARSVAQHLADEAADLEAEPRRELPTLAVSATGDQVAVCGHDLLAACDRAAARELDRDVDAVLDAAAELVLDLRRRI